MQRFLDQSHIDLQNQSFSSKTFHFSRGASVLLLSQYYYEGDLFLGKELYSLNRFIFSSRNKAPLVVLDKHVEKREAF